MGKYTNTGNDKNKVAKGANMKTINRLLTIGLLAMAASVEAQQVANYQVVPLPRSIEAHEGTFVLNAENASEAIRTRVLPTDKRWAAYPVPDEAYEIEIGKKGIDIVAKSEAGVFYAEQMLRKAMQLKAEKTSNEEGTALPLANISGLTEEVALPFVTIKDGPEFSYRGVHLDCSRHFFPMDFLKRYIDLIALHGCNVLHWHLTDDQGWRFEVKKYPRLTEVGSSRKNTVVGHNLPLYDHVPVTGYYSQDECRELVRYAAERHITIMPEVDLPGHMVAALASYPELGCTGGPYETWNMWGVHDDVLCAGNPKTLQFVCDVLEELIDVFPSQLIHLGGDECPKVRWEECPKCQAKISELGIKAHDGLTAENQLQNWLMHEAEVYLNNHGRSMIGWDEILEGGAGASATVMSWRGLEGGIAAAKTGHDVVMTPIDYCYLNFYQSTNHEYEPFSFDGYVPLSKAYTLPVVPEQLTAEESKHVLGCQANLWAEYITTPEQAEWMLLPRLAAISEAQWMPAGRRDYQDFLERLPWLTQYYQMLGYRCSNKRE